MPTTIWIGNAAKKAQVITGTVTAVALGGTLTATLNSKTTVYTCTASDTTSTAAAAFQALLAAQVNPEFGLATYAVDGAVVTATAATPGEPFSGMTGGLAFTAAGGAAITQATVQANVSPSSAIDNNNWLRAGVPGIPQNGDDVVVADSDVPILWDLDGLAAVQFATYKRYQSFEAQVGLPEQNPLGFREFRPTYLQFVGSAATLPLTLGLGPGAGPTRERYNFLTQRTDVVALASGQAEDAYAVRLLGTNANNTILASQTSVGVAMTPGEVSTIASATVDGGGTLDLGSGVTFSGALVVLAGTSGLACAPASVTVVNGSAATLVGDGLTYTAITATGGSQLTVEAVGTTTITTLVLRTGSTLDKPGLPPLTITNSTVEGDTCQILDPNSSITFTNATSVSGQVSSGPFQFSGTRTVKIT